MAEIKEPIAGQELTALPLEKQTDGKVSYGEDRSAEEYAHSVGMFQRFKAKHGTKSSKKKKKHPIRWIIIGVIVVAGVVLLVKLLTPDKKDEGEAVTDTVQYGSITSTVEGNGLTKAANSKAIMLNTTGTVQEVYVKEGDQVTAGTPLFSVDSPAARTAVQTAQNQVSGYQKQLNALEKDIAGLNLSASYAGKLLSTVKLQKGDPINKGDKVAQLVDDTNLRLKQYYSYAYQGKIRAGQTASVSIPSMMSNLTGTVESVHMVSRITPEGSKLFEADILLKNPGTLTADMAATATVNVGGETVYSYEAGKLEYSRSKDLTASVSGTVISSNLVDYMSVSAGQVLVKIDGEDSQNQLFTLQQQLATAQSDLDKAQKNLDNMNAVAPIDGTVMGLAIAPGDELSGTATTAINIADTSTILIDATVDERNISYVKSGMMVDIDQWGTPFSGTVQSVSLSSKVENGVASYPMVISVDNADGTMLTGSNVTYTLTASENDNCLLLPIQCVKSATLADGTNVDVVFVQSDSRPDTAIDLPDQPEDVPDGFWAVPVETGISDDYNVEIQSGVEEGTTVFTQMQTTGTP